MKLRAELEACTVLASLLCSSVALAQGDTTGVPGTDDASRPTAKAGIEEVLVTARRREESAQTVPVSVTAFTGAALEQRNVRDLEGLNLITPGLRFTAEGGKTTTTVILRGLGRNPIGEGVPAVVTYFADVAVVGEGTNLPTYDLASVQVLKGPQGTLFGRNTLGGAVVIQPQAPTYEFGGYVKGEYGRYDHRLTEGALNVPLVDDKVALRLAGQIRRRDGSVENLSGGEDFNDLDQQAFRASLRLDLTDNFTNTTIFDYFRADENAGGLYLYQHNAGVIPGLSAALDPQIAAYRRDQLDEGFHAVSSQLEQGNNPPGSADRKLTGIVNDSKLRLGGITLRNIFGYRETQLHATINTSGLGPTTLGPVPFTVFIAEAESSREYLTEEFQILGDLFDDRLNFIVGAFYNNDKPFEAGGSHFVAFSTTGAAPFVTSHIENENEAIYAQIGYKLTDQLTFNLGGRYSWDEVSGCGGAIGTGYVTFEACKERAALGAVDGVDLIESEGEEPSWTVGFDYQATDDIFLYVTSRRGYRGVNLNTPAFETAFTTGGTGCALGTAAVPCPDLRPFQTIGEEEITDVEIGSKWDWQAGSVTGRVNVAVFRTDYKDALQFFNVIATGIPQSTPDFPAKQSIGVNAADMTIEGVELEALVIPVSGLTINFNGAFTDTTVDSVDIPPIGGLRLTEADITKFTPKFTSTLGVNWELPVRPFDSALVVSSDWFHTEKFGAQNGRYLPGYDVVNARVALNEISGTQLDLAVVVRNVADEEYFTAASNLLTTFPTNTVYTGDQRMWAVEATYRF